MFSSRKFIQDALNYPLFKDFDSYVDVDGNLLPTAPQKWLDLVNGVEYTNDNKTLKWQGLIFTEGSVKNSVLAYYTYYEWLLQNVSSTTVMGQVVGLSKGASNVNSSYKVMKVQNKMVETKSARLHLQ